MKNIYSIYTSMMYCNGVCFLYNLILVIEHIPSLFRQLLSILNLMIRIDGNANCKKKAGNVIESFKNRIYASGQTFLGAGSPQPAPGNIFSRAGRGVTRPWKCIFIGG